jgi:hypothetical protein
MSDRGGVQQVWFGHAASRLRAAVHHGVVVDDNHDEVVVDAHVRNG